MFLKLIVTSEKVSREIDPSDTSVFTPLLSTIWINQNVFQCDIWLKDELKIEQRYEVKVTYWYINTLVYGYTAVIRFIPVHRDKLGSSYAAILNHCGP